MTFHARRKPDTAKPMAAPPMSRPVRDGRIVSPEEAVAIDDRRALLAKLDACQAEMNKQFKFVSEGSIVGDQIKTLAAMFGHSLAAVDGDGDGIEFGCLVADIMEVMAARLGALEHQARASLSHCEARVA